VPSGSPTAYAARKTDDEWNFGVSKVSPIDDPLDKRLEGLERRLVLNRKRQEIMGHLRNLMALVDTDQIEAARREYADRIQRASADSRYKYRDVAYYTLQKLLLAYKLGLNRGVPHSVLDIGTGAGHFPFVCRYFGHHVVGIDIRNSFYDRIAGSLGVDRTHVAVEPGKLLPYLGGPFDLITACAITFSEIRTSNRRKSRIYWSLAEWQFLLDDLMAHQLRYPGRLYLTLNKQWHGRFFGFDLLSFDRQLLTMAARNGAIVHRSKGTIDLSLASRRPLSLQPSG
jgi:SAM-dependent methyltransferase